MGTKWAIVSMLVLISGRLCAENQSAYAQAANNFLDELDGKDVDAVKLPTEEKQNEHDNGHGDHSEHEGHNSGHGSHGAHGGHEGHMMKMWFHGGFEEVILFDFWRTDSLFGMLLSCAAIFIMGATYEGVKWFRVFLQMSQSQSQVLANKSCVEFALQTTRSSGGTCHQSISRSQSNKPQSEPFLISTVTRSPATSPFSPQRIIQMFLYILQLVLAYWLMLIVMTYNTYLTAAVVLGAGFGHWLFAVLQLRSSDGEVTDSFQTDACH
uniref:Copper transport protein n=1 Tax=Caenorhabditis tropicalis TaxID=1561998 RepID=A0A1I7UY28_9PELO